MTYHLLDNEQHARIERMMPLRVIVELNQSANVPEVRALCEESWSMNFYTDRAMIFWSSDNASSNLGGSFKVNGPNWARENHKAYQLDQLVFDPLAEDCPIEIDWLDWLTQLAKSDGSKFDKRNARFQVKPHGLWQMRALVAEARQAHNAEELRLLNDSHSKLEATVNSITQIINPQTEEE